MGVARIAAGEEFEVLTQDELRTVLDETLSGYLRSPYRVRIVENGVTDSSGNCLIEDVAKSRAGMALLVLRLTIGAQGFTFASPFNTGGAVQLIRAGGGAQAGDVMDGTLLGNTGEPNEQTLPWVYTESRDRAIDIRDQETLQVQIIGGPHSTPITIFGHGVMVPLPPD